MRLSRAPPRPVSTFNQESARGVSISRRTPIDSETPARAFFNRMGRSLAALLEASDVLGCRHRGPSCRGRVVGVLVGPHGPFVLSLPAREFLEPCAHPRAPPLGEDQEGHRRGVHLIVMEAPGELRQL